jgi:16S rRNA processing protein RimM
MVAIGKILKTHGYKGNLRITYDNAYRDDLEVMAAIFLEEKGEILPWFITYKEITTNGEAIIGLENILSSEEARMLCGKKIYAREEDLTVSLEQHPYAQLESFTASDTVLGDIGKIQQVLEMPGQMMAVIDHHGREVMIPLNEAFVKKIDRRKKMALFELPEGLLDLNL